MEKNDQNVPFMVIFEENSVKITSKIEIIDGFTTVFLTPKMAEISFEIFWGKNIFFSLKIKQSV